MKLSPTMQAAMDALPLHFSRFGSSTMGHDFPKGVTMRTVGALQDRGLVEIKNRGVFWRTVVAKGPVK